MCGSTLRFGRGCDGGQCLAFLNEAHTELQSQNNHIKTQDLVFHGTNGIHGVLYTY